MQVILGKWGNNLAVRLPAEIVRAARLPGCRPRDRDGVTTEEAGYVPAAGDLIWTDFDPGRGREQAGRRPALVVSAAAFSANTWLAVVCSITSRVRPFPTKRRAARGLAGGRRDPDQPRAQHRYLARPVRYAGAAVPSEVAHRVRAKLQSVITI